MDNSYQYSERDRAEISVFLPDTYKKVLEVGCGFGGFKKNLKIEAEIFGVEPNESAAIRARSNGYKVLQGTFESVLADLTGHRFDLIICNDVIEHMPDHDKFLQEIKKYIEPGGCLIGSVPNVRYFENLYSLLILKDWKYANVGILDRTHLRFFTKKSLLRTFRDNGYKVDKLDGINNVFTTPARSVGQLIRFARIVRNIALIFLIIISLGYFQDTCYPQFGFRIYQ